LTAWALHLEKGARDRAGEEAVVSRLILDALGEACGISDRPPLPLGAGDRLSSESIDFAAEAKRLRQREIAYFGIEPDGAFRSSGNPPAAILSGSFNPLHAGHVGLAETAAALLERPVSFEVSAANVDKPPLETAVLLDRMSQFAGRWPAVAGNAPTFVEKSRLYPGAVFVVGFDTAARTLQPRYYGDSVSAMLAALAEIRERGNRFLVAGREGADGIFRGMAALAIPEGYAGLFQAIPPELFRHDLSSTEIRAALADEKLREEKGR
jgi:hypothetical protein